VSLDGKRSDGEAMLQGQLIAGRYRVEELLGSGGMGTVYRGMHVLMHKAVAIKVLHREMTERPQLVARFQREAIAAARIDHQNVVAATDFGQLEDGSFYLILEYVQGRSLRSVLDSTPALPAARALHVTRQILAGLVAAHGAGVVHRDLKPDNVMLVEHGGDADFVKVLDFGIAKITAAGSPGRTPLTQAGSVFGTPEYMSPEQARGAPADARSDLYAVGILLYQMLAGRSPFADDSEIAMLAAQIAEPPPPLPDSVDPAVAAIVMQLLAKEPEQRMQTAGEVLQRLDAVGPQAAQAGAIGSAPTILQSAPTLPGPPRHAARVVVWALGVGGVVVASAALILLAVVVVRPRAVAGPAASTSVPAEGPSEASRWIACAAEGDREALSRLQARPESQRSVAEWHALGRGTAQIRDYGTSVAAYAQALRLDANVSEDPDVQSDLRQALEAPQSFAEAVALCRSALGSPGVDLLYDFWLTHRANPAQKDAVDAVQEVLDETEVRSRASSALQLALRLQDTRGCAAYKQLLPWAATDADARSLPYLTQLQATSGCGLLGMGDCYACLRSDQNLAVGLSRAKTHPAPSFGSAP
jgi:eukaryotic-like serine/threonine-protein kinase